MSAKRDPLAGGADLSTRTGDPGLHRLAAGALLISFQGTTAPDWVLRGLEDGLGGVCLFGFNVADGEQVAALSARLNEAGRPVVSLDEEGGDVTRLAYHTGSAYPGNAALGAVDDVALTERVDHARAAVVARGGGSVE
jgi:beta-N-acetylhexosaminidase